MERLLITYAVKERDSYIMGRIAHRLEKMAPSLQMLLLDYCDPHFFSKLIEFEPDSILSFPIEAGSVGENFSIVKYLFDNKHICYPKEELFDANDDSGIELYASLFGNYDDNLIDYILHWGPVQNNMITRRLVEKNMLKSTEQALTTGYVPYENYFNDYWPKAVTPFDEKVKGYSCVCLFATGFGDCSLTIKQTIANGDSLSPDIFDFPEELKEFKDSRQNTREFLSIFEESIVKSAQKHKDTLFVIKPHPIELKYHEVYQIPLYERIDCFENVLVLREPSQLIDLINRTDVFFHMCSTTVLESYLAEKVSCQLTYHKVKQHKNFFRYDLFDSFSNYETEVDCLDEIITEYKAGRLSFRENLEIQKYLHDFFNLDIQEVRSGKKCYCPSEDVARFVLELPQINHIAADNAFLSACINGPLGLMFIQHFVVLLHKFLHDDDKFEAVSNHFKKFMALVDDKDVKGTFSKLEAAFSARDKDGIVEVLKELCILQVCGKDFCKARLNKDLKIALFGTGALGKSAYHLLKAADLQVSLFFDNDPEKENQCLSGVKIVNPCAERVEALDFVLVCSMYYDEISTQLLAMGCHEDKIIKCEYYANYDDIWKEH